MGNHHFVLGKSTISMAIFNSYFDITRGYYKIIPTYGGVLKCGIPSGHLKFLFRWSNGRSVLDDLGLQCSGVAHDLGTFHIPGLVNIEKASKSY